MDDSVEALKYFIKFLLIMKRARYLISTIINLEISPTKRMSWSYTENRYCIVVLSSTWTLLKKRRAANNCSWWLSLLWKGFIVINIVTKSLDCKITSRQGSHILLILCSQQEEWWPVNTIISARTWESSYPEHYLLRRFFC